MLAHALTLNLRTLMLTRTPLVHWTPPTSSELPIIPCARYAQNSANVPEMPGAGAAKRLLSHARENWSAFFLFAAEGDNREDAHALAACVAHAVGLPNSSLPEPPSWRIMYGPEPTGLLYG